MDFRFEHLRAGDGGGFEVFVGNIVGRFEVFLGVARSCAGYIRLSHGLVEAPSAFKYDVPSARSDTTARTVPTRRISKVCCRTVRLTSRLSCS